jgi:hypothetical protein
MGIPAMTKIACLLTPLVGALVFLLPVAPAQAQRDRVFIASYGSDSNPCTFGSPCKTFQNAVNVVAAGGEVTAIDSAGFGPVTIAQSVTITSPNGVEAGIVAPSGGNAIAIDATSAATITLRGLTLEGDGIDAHGIFLTSTGGGTLNIINTVVKDFTNSGIDIQPAAATTTLTISNSVSLNNGNNGINIAPTAGAHVNFAIDQVTANNNSANGIVLNGNNVTGTLTRSQANLNSQDGVVANISVATIRNCGMGKNGNIGLAVTNGAITVLSGSELTLNGTEDLSTDNASATDTFGDNVLFNVQGATAKYSLQ